MRKHPAMSRLCVVDARAVRVLSCIFDNDTMQSAATGPTMKTTQSHLTRLLPLALLIGLTFLPAEAQQSRFRGSGGNPGDVARYLVTINLDPGDDRDAVAARLAATYALHVEPHPDGSPTQFAVTTTAARARLIARDPHVTRVQETGAAGAPQVPAADTVRPVTVAPSAVPGLGAIAYDPAGNITSIGAGSSAQSLLYDDFGRLTKATRTTATQDYTYDRYGNMVTLTTTPTGGTAQVTRMGVHSDSNRVDQTVDPSGTPANMVATYDAAGNVTSTPTASFVYDALNVVRESTTDVRRLYVYNASDERIASIEYLTGKESWTLRDPENRVLRRFTRSSGTWTWDEDYIYGAGRLIAAEVSGPARVLHFHLDHLGSPRLITGNGGAQVAQHDYYPFGGEVPGSTNDGERLKFTGHERDLPGTLDYMHARYYDGMMGRFLSVDPALPLKATMKSPQAWNRYAYVRNDPARKIDPDGECEICLENALQREQLAVVRGEMTLDEYNARNKARGVGALLGAAPWAGLLGVRAALTWLGVGGAATAGAGGGTTILLGENMMERIAPAAQELNAGVFNTQWTNFADVMTEDMSWLQGQINQGTKILDVGRDIGRAAPSEFYQAEVNLLQANGYAQEFVKFIMVNGEVMKVMEWVRVTQ